MKKIISAILCLTVLLSGFAVMAQGQTNSPEMEQALLSVKAKVDIPADFTQFDSSGYTNNSKVTYNFTWSREDSSAYIDIQCDAKGRIERYRYYADDMYEKSESNRISLIDREEVIKQSDSFMQKLLPEAFASESDLYVCDKENIWANASSNGTVYNIPYKRMKDNCYVENNTASVSLTASGDKITVTSVSSQFDYDTEFAEEDALKDFDYYSAYKSQFPAEMVYVKVYDEDDVSTKLVYRFKDSTAGYISAATGEAVEKDTENIFGILGENSAADSEASKGQGGGFTPEEIEELNRVANLKTADEIEKTVRSISVLKMDSSAKLLSSSLTKYDDEYTLHLTFGKDEEDGYALSVSADAKTGKIKNIYNYGYSIYADEEATDAQKQKADEAMDKFVSEYAADDYAKCKASELESNKMTASKSYERMENSVPVIGESISISYDMKNDKLSYYSNYIDESLTFESSEGALSDEEAYQKLTEYAPINLVYIKSGGVFVLCYSANENQYTQIDAKTGEKYEPYASDQPKAEYTDLQGHWSEQAVKKLGEVGIALPGDKFNPDISITQEDLLRLFAAGCISRSYINYSADELYNSLYNEGIITKEERNDTAAVTREDAFVFMIRFARLERVAKLSKIFTLDFGDSNLVSADKVGYAAILYGMGVIGGDNSGVRPLDNITRAEAASMLYNYLSLN